MRFLESDHSDKVPLVHSNAFTRFMLLKKDTAWPNDVYCSGNRFVFFKKMLEQTKEYIKDWYDHDPKLKKMKDSMFTADQKLA